MPLCTGACFFSDGNASLSEWVHSVACMVLAYACAQVRRLPSPVSTASSVSNTCEPSACVDVQVVVHIVSTALFNDIVKCELALHLPYTHLPYTEMHSVEYVGVRGAEHIVPLLVHESCVFLLNAESYRWLGACFPMCRPKACSEYPSSPPTEASQLMEQQSGTSNSVRSFMNEATSSVPTSHAISNWLRTNAGPSLIQNEVDMQFL
jgi:hypothetical protein